MKKIMFNDKYGLTEAVLEGRKTQTRRLLHHPKTFGGKYVSGFRLCTNREGIQFAYLVDEDECEINGSVNVLSAYKMGEEVAIAQSYFDCGYTTNARQVEIVPGHFAQFSDGSAGWNNKMFVRADLMPHRIKITNIRIERLQDISEQDCLKEGVYYHTEPPKHHEYDRYSPWSPSVKPYKFESEKYFCSAKYAFKHLIDKVSGKGTWESNPYVFVYDFELIK